MILGSAGESVPVGDGELCLGTWQRVLFIELDRSRPRRWLCKVVGSYERLARRRSLRLVDRERLLRVAPLRVELEDPELAAHHVHGDVVDRARRRSRLRTSRGARGRARRGPDGAPRSGRRVGPRRARATAARARRRASPRPASSAAARAAPRTARSRRGPRSRPSTSFVVSAYASRKMRLAEVRPLLPEAADESLHARDADARAVDRQDRVRPVEHHHPRLGERARRGRRAGRTASRGCRARRRRGTDRSRQASATTQTSSTCPCCVRSPASRIRSACSSTRLNASRTRSRSAAPAWMSPAAATRTVFAMPRSYPDSRVPFAGTDAAMPSDGDRQRSAGRDEARRRGAARQRDRRSRSRAGTAIYARGGPESGHDVDFVLREADAEHALHLLGEAGFRGERPARAAGSTRSTTRTTR